MKNLVAIIFLIYISFSFMACSATNRLTMGVTQPAQIPLATEVAHIGIINRSIASEKNKTLDKIDKVLSLEGINLDKEGAQNAINGLSQELEHGNRFETVRILEGQPAFEKGLGVFPAPLSWEMVAQICNENKLDVLFSLEVYDTNTAVEYEMAMVNIPNKFGIVAEIPGHRIVLHTAIKNGWRVYDPTGKILVDEFISNDLIVSKGEGINPMNALEAIIGRKEAVLRLSSNLGVNYGLFTKPQRIRIARDYFIRGSNYFKIAKRRAQTGNWDGASELWKAELNNPKAKIAGRAYYNMAISHEINGNLDQAIEFASISYTDYGNNNGLHYWNMLKKRRGNQQELKRQLAR